MSRYRPHPRDEILAVMDRIYRHRMTTTSGGNVSIRDDEGTIWITPARLDKGALRRSEIVPAPREAAPAATLAASRSASASSVAASTATDATEPARGPRPSSELPFHRAIYRERPDLQAVVHAHPPALVAFSMARQLPETRLFPQAWHVCGQPAMAPYALPGSERLGASIAAEFARGAHCVLLENHGVVVGGADLTQAFQRFEALEFAAQTAIRARTLGTARVLNHEQLAAPQRRRLDFLSGPAAAPSSHEKELRGTLCEFVKRGCQQRLLISTEGSFSVRLNDLDFVITPSQRDRWTLQPEDLVHVSGNYVESGKTPSRASRCHQAIYQRHPDVQAVCLAHPVHATAYSVTGTSFDSRTIPESYLVLRDVGRLPFGLPYHDGAGVAALVSMQRPAALLENDGVLVLGASILDAFDRLEVLEATAEALIFSERIGGASPMPDVVIEELRNHFLKS
jgi:L-fuculose-phosphate aldolase